VIAIRGVRKSFGSNLVLDGISLEVSQGEVVCVIGPSGSGKSTLLRCVNGLESYDAGEITVEGQRVDRDARNIVAIREKRSRWYFSDSICFRTARRWRT
jgi:polar amino acid transport system ATP-binding protein